MKLRIFLFAVIATLLYKNASAQKKPNIIIIISDDHAYQAIGAYGSKYGKTPQIDRIAAQVHYLKMSSSTIPSADHPEQHY